MCHINNHLLSNDSFKLQKVRDLHSLSHTLTQHYRFTFTLTLLPTINTAESMTIERKRYQVTHFFVIDSTLRVNKSTQLNPMDEMIVFPSRSSVK